MIVTHSTVLAQPRSRACGCSVTIVSAPPIILHHSRKVHIDDDRITYKMWQFNSRSEFHGLVDRAHKRYICNCIKCETQRGARSLVP
jgi:hypothetical protein